MSETESNKAQQVNDQDNSDQNGNKRQLLDVRCGAWSSLTILSIIALYALTSSSNNSQFRSFDEKWVLSMICLSLIFSLMGAMIHVAPVEKLNKMVSTRAEITMIGTVLISWISGLPVINAPWNGIAISSFHVVNANLYFSSWGSFILAAVIAVNIGRERGILSAANAGTSQWVILMIISFVTVGTCSRMIQATGCMHPYMSQPVMTHDVCDNLDLGVALTSTSAAITICMLILSRFAAKVKSSALIGMLAGFAVFALWTTALLRLTFGNSPGNHVGNLFFGTWIGFMVSSSLAGTHLKLYNSERDGEMNQNYEDKAHDNTTVSVGEFIENLEVDTNTDEESQNMEKV